MNERNQQRLRRLEAFYAETQHPWGDEPDKLVVDHIDDFLPDSVLDLGCGDGRNALHLAQRGFAVTAVDIVRAAIDELRREADSRDLAIETHVADVATFPVSRSYANVVCTLTLHFLPRAQAAKLLARVKLHTAPSGLNVISVYTRDGPLYLPESEAFWLAPGELRDLYDDWEMVYSGRRISRTTARSETGGRFAQPTDEIVARKR
jgi:tellurite methyltransferase